MARKPKTEADATPMLALVDQDAPTGGALVVADPDTPIEVQARRAAQIVLLQPERFDQFYERMRAETAAHVADMTTAAGRDELRALAFRVTKTKTTLEKAALDLTADWRAKTKAVNDARKPIVDRLAGLADDVRKPLTDWETAEAARIAANRAVIDEARTAATVRDDDTSATVEARGRATWALLETFVEPQWTAEEAVEAVDAVKASVHALVAAKAVLVQKEADAAELAQLRAEREAREKREAEEQAERDRQAAEAREAAEKAAQRRQYAESVIEHIREVGRGMIGGRTYPYVILIRELEEKVEIDESFGDLEAEARKVLAETLASVKEAQERQAQRAREEAENERRREAERVAEDAAKAAREKAEAEAAAILAKEKADRERIENEAREAAEKRKREDEEREIAAQAARQNAERERRRVANEQAETERLERERKADAKHRREVIEDAVVDLEAACPGINPDMARDIINAVASGQVRHVEVQF